MLNSDGEDGFKTFLKASEVLHQRDVLGVG